MKRLQNQFTILLIENDSDWQADLCARLRGAGYDVLTAAGGDEGFCVARRLRPDLILCEAALPDISGVQLCYMLRADANLSAALIVLTGESGDAAEAFRAGANDYFEKDGSREFLLAKIARLLDLQNAEADLRRRCRNLRRSERHLAKLIEDASHLVRVLDPATEFAAAPPKSFFGASVKPRKKTNDSENWKRLMQPRKSVEASKFADPKREKVYYEIVR